MEKPGVSAGAVLVTDRTNVQLSPETVTTDVVEFEAALAAAQRALPELPHLHLCLPHLPLF